MAKAPGAASAPLDAQRREPGSSLAQFAGHFPRAEKICYSILVVHVVQLLTVVQDYDPHST